MSKKVDKIKLDFSALAEQWLASVSYGVKESTLAHYDYTLQRYLLPVFGAWKVHGLDEQRLEQIMDGLCDFCDESRFIDLYRSLCRHIYYQYPQLVGEHVALFRALFEGNDNASEQGKEQKAD